MELAEEKKRLDTGANDGMFRRRSILFRTARLSWIVTILALGLFILFIIPYQRNTLIERMESTAEVVGTSIEQVTVTSIVVEDYSAAIEHCLKVVNERPMILYLVITRRDGFSLVHAGDVWKSETLGGFWRPVDGEISESSFIYSNLVEEDVFHYAHPLSYSGIDWGWIHVGLSLEQFNADLRSIYIRTILMAVLCMLAGSVVSIFFARRLSRPIQRLNEITMQVADGDLTVRADISSRDEVESLAYSFNRMTESLQKAREELERRIKERTQAEEQVRASLVEKEVLLKEIHHRVKNNLQVISSLLNLQSDTVADEKALEVLRESQNRIRSMAFVHENLYQSEDLARIDFGGYIRNLSAYLFSSYSVNSSLVRLRLDVEDVHLGIDTVIPCGLVVNELISNALKHAFPEGREGEIYVTLRAEDGQVILVIGDDGIGLPEGLNVAESETLGLQLVETLVGQLEGEIELGNTEGTEFRIVFRAI